MSTNLRIKGRRLQTIRKRAFADTPVCVGGKHSDGTPFGCVTGKVVETAQRDHILPIGKGGLDTENNTQYICDRCHAMKTARDMGWRERVQIGEDGWPI